MLAGVSVVGTRCGNYLFFLRPGARSPFIIYDCGVISHFSFSRRLRSRETIHVVSIRPSAFTCCSPKSIVYGILRTSTSSWPIDLTSTLEREPSDLQSDVLGSIIRVFSLPSSFRRTLNNQQLDHVCRLFDTRNHTAAAIASSTDCITSRPVNTTIGHTPSTTRVLHWV